MLENARLLDPLEIANAKIDIACLQRALLIGVSRPGPAGKRRHQLKTFGSCGRSSGSAASRWSRSSGADRLRCRLERWDSGPVSGRSATVTALRTGIGIRLRPPGSLLGQRAVDTARVCRPRACSVRRAPPAVLCTDKSMAIASVAMAGCVVLLQLLAAVFVWSGNRGGGGRVRRGRRHHGCLCLHHVRRGERSEVPAVAWRRTSSPACGCGVCAAMPRR